MANHNQNGGRDVALPEDSQPSWRPEDPPPVREFRRRDARGDDLRDERGWRGRRFDDDRRSDQGVRGPRHGDDRLTSRASRAAGDDAMPSAGSFEDRYRDLGSDDRSGAEPERSGYWLDRGGDLERYPVHSGYRGRDFEPERSELPRGRGEGHPGGARACGDERMGYAAGSYRRYPDTRQDAEDAGRRATEPHVHCGTGPHRGKGPVGYQRSDERIRELVCDSLTEDDEVDASHIEIAVHDGEVTLSGTVDDRRAKRDAEDCACSVPGVRDVQNLLRVQRDGRPRDNPAMAAPVGTHETSAHDRKHRA